MESVLELVCKNKASCYEQLSLNTEHYVEMIVLWAAFIKKEDFFFFFVGGLGAQCKTISGRLQFSTIVAGFLKPHVENAGL